MYDKFFKEREKIGIPTDESNLNKITDTYNSWIKGFNADDDVKKFMIWDYELLCCMENSLHIGIGGENRLDSVFQWNNGTRWPDIKNFEDERIEFYKECVNKTENKSMKIRYLDYLLECEKVKNKYIFANELCNELISVCTVKDNDYFSFFSKVSRLVDISVKFNKKDIMKKSEDILINESEKLIENKTYRWILEIAKLFRYLCYYKKEKRIEQTTIDEIINQLKISREYLIKNKETMMYQYFSWELVNWYRTEKYEEVDIMSVLIDIGKSFELEAEYQGGMEEKSNLVKAHFLESAIQHYINIGENSRIPELKVKVKKAYKDMKTNNELKETSTKIEIPNKVINEQADKFILEDVEKSFELLSRIPYFIPEKKKIQDSAKKIYEESVFTKLAELSTIYEGRKIFQSDSDEESFMHQFNQQYDIGIKITYSILYKEVWKRLLKQGLTAEMVVERITNWDYIDEGDKIIVEKGIRSFFNNDYISTLHILVPKFESCFREFFEWGGYATTSIKSNTTQHEQNFNDFLRNDFVEKNIEENFLFFIKYVMVEDIGYNLRNNIAHGLASLETFNSTNAYIVMYMFFMLTNLVWEKPKFGKN